MLTRLYVEALLANENLADQVWELWNAGLISEDLAAWAWRLIAFAIEQTQNGNLKRRSTGTLGVGRAKRRSSLRG